MQACRAQCSQVQQGPQCSLLDVPVHEQADHPGHDAWREGATMALAEDCSVVLWTSPGMSQAKQADTQQEGT